MDTWPFGAAKIAKIDRFPITQHVYCPIQVAAYPDTINDTPGGPKTVQSIAFENPDGTLALVVFNKTDASERFAIKPAPDALPFAAVIPAHSIQTYTTATATANAAGQ